jgi:hypothetical protein
MPDWECNEEFEWALRQLDWQPRTEREEIYLRICQRQVRELTEAWDRTRRLLLKDALSLDKRRVHNAVLTFVSLGREDVVPELERILDQHGDKEMAETYLNCGNKSLADKARDWAAGRGYRISSGRGSHEADWGGWR